LRAIVEAVVAHRFGLTQSDLSEVVKECDYPASQVCSSEFARTLNPKGFWRFEKNEPPEHRLAVLAQIAFQDLGNRGMADFQSQNGGQGWMPPETLRLADYGLGHDDRAKHHQPVASALGPRFYPQQLEQSAEESWEECERHAEVLAKLLPPPDREKKRIQTPATPSPSICSVTRSIPICLAVPFTRNPENARSPWPEC